MIAPLSLALALVASVAAQDSSAINATATPSATVSSNVTLAPASQTATWSSSMPSGTSVPYVWPNVTMDGLPAFTWNLSMNDAQSRTLLCQRQVSWCAKAGCADSDAKVADNFCDDTNMGTRCTCDKGASRLAQVQWPVSSADCVGRNTACVNACLDVNVTPSANRASCEDKCKSVFAQNCGMPGAYAADYSVAKEGQTPSYAVVQGGNAADAAFNLRSPVALSAAIAAVVALVSLA